MTVRSIHCRESRYYQTVSCPESTNQGTWEWFP